MINEKKSSNMSLTARNNGFTLLELLIVLVILTALAVVAIPMFKNQADKSKNVAHNSNVKMIEKQGELYLLEPDNLNYTDGQNIIEDVINTGYLKEIPKNPITGERDYKIIYHSATNKVAVEPAAVDLAEKTTPNNGGVTEPADTIAPTATVNYSIVTPTTGSIIATIVPSETVIVTNNGGSLSYTFTANGRFTFEFKDSAGNTGSVTATVNNIDSEAPIVPTFTATPTTATNGSVTVTITYPEDSNLNEYKIGSGSWNTYSMELTISENSTVYAKATDTAGNTSTEVSLSITNIDKVAPTATVSYSTTVSTTGNVTATIVPSETVTVTNNGGNTSYTFTANGSFTFEFKDTAGNTGSATATVNNIVTLAKGQYLKLGQYYATSTTSSPIIWRIINIDGSGNLFLLSDKIISMKAYDAADAAATGSDGYRKFNGSNLWMNSNIREWLNSNESANNVTYTTQKPDSANVSSGVNSYAAEAGFLSNFTENEKLHLVSVTHKSIIDYDSDSVYSNGGTVEHGYESAGVDESISVSLGGNYNIAYYTNTTDKVFLPSLGELSAYVDGVLYHPGTSTGYEIAYTTDGVARQSNFFSDPAAGAAWIYWVRDAATSSSINLRLVTENGYVSGSNAFNGMYGIRPALVLSPSGMKLTSGTGADNNNAYTVSWN